MSSNGLRRGLAPTALAALAVTGLPLAPAPAPSAAPANNENDDA